VNDDIRGIGVENHDETVVPAMDYAVRRSSLRQRKIIAKPIEHNNSRSKDSTSKKNHKNVIEVQRLNGRYVCTICSKDFATKRNLNDHKESKHLNKRFPCNCGKEFAFRYHLWYHNRSVHLNIRHKCGKCSMRLKEFVSISNCNNIYI
jgi:uncharacterized Zn-finger protein